MVATVEINRHSEDYRAGHRDGYEEGVDDGYLDGHDTGYGAGYTDGRNRALDECEAQVTAYDVINRWCGGGRHPSPVLVDITTEAIRELARLIDQSELSSQLSPAGRRLVEQAALR